MLKRDKGMTMSQYQDHNEVIQLLSELYPKCFFANPQQRRPLKHRIIDDIEQADDPRLAGFDVSAAINWYEGHIGYDYACSQAGTVRLNLDGNVIGKVTLSEAQEAQEHIASKGEEISCAPKK
jgi:sRNA-binding protein